MPRLMVSHPQWPVSVSLAYNNLDLSRPLIIVCHGHKLYVTKNYLEGYRGYLRLAETHGKHCLMVPEGYSESWHNVHNIPVNLPVSTHGRQLAIGLNAGPDSSGRCYLLHFAFPDPISYTTDVAMLFW